MAKSKEYQRWQAEVDGSIFEEKLHEYPPDEIERILERIGVNEGALVLDAGCGTGRFSSFMASSSKRPKVVGLDISLPLVDYGKAKRTNEWESRDFDLLNGDVSTLPFPDDCFDAVISKSLLNVLLNPERAMIELIRVCKPNGAVACIFGAGFEGSTSFSGQYHCEWNDRLVELKDKINAAMDRISSGYIKSEKWHKKKYPILFHHVGLKEVKLYSFGQCFSPSDTRYSIEYRRKTVIGRIERHIEIAKRRSRLPSFVEQGITLQDFEEYIELLKQKLDYIREKLDTDHSWEWSANVCLLLVGKKGE